MSSKLLVGVDVSNKELDYLFCEPSVRWNQLAEVPVEQIPNTSRSIDRFVSTLPPNVGVVFEPTGTYSDKLLSALSARSIPFSLVSPSKAHYFAQTMGVIQKTDQSAARLLAYMGAKMELPHYQPDSPENRQRKQILAALKNAEKDKQAAANQLHALAQRAQPNQQVKACYESKKQEAQKRIELLSQELDRHQDPNDQAVEKLAMTVVGVGKQTVQWLMTYTNSLRNFHDVRSLLSYCGLAPRKHRSGSSVNRNGGITKQVNAKIRACLYMGAISAIRFNLACKDLYQRLRARGKPHYKAIVAVMAKLVKQVFGVVKSGKKFDNQYFLKFQ